METNYHIPVMLEEAIQSLDIKPDGIYFDCTAGGGGHSLEIAKRLTGGRLYCIDQDEDAIEHCAKILRQFGNVELIKDNFVNLGEIITSHNIGQADGFLFDLGVSSHQLDEPNLGFSYNSEAVLDMRMNKQGALTARDIVNLYTENELSQIIFQYGEERYSKRIARFIVENRPIDTTTQLGEIVKRAVGASANKEKQHPARRTFQALRIEVNKELEILESSVRTAISHTKPGGKVSVITFHSLEDRIIKNLFNELAGACKCPKNFPVCICGITPSVKLCNKKPIEPSEQEKERNYRSHSAKMRSIVKL